MRHSFWCTPTIGILFGGRLVTQVSGREVSKPGRWVNEKEGVIEGVKLMVGATVGEISNALMHSRVQCEKKVEVRKKGMS